MSLMNGQQYIASLKARQPLKVYLSGEQVTDITEHPLIKPSIQSVALTYDAAFEAENAELMTAKSALSGEIINRFCHLHQSERDLINKVKMQRMLGRRCGTCFQRCVGMDALNAIFACTYDADKKYGTQYHDRFLNFMRQAEKDDWIIDGAMTDVKGDRSKRPSEQLDPDLFLRVVERTNKGVLIRGAKAHQTGALNSHQILVMPTQALKPNERDYAICCSLPVDAPNIVYIYGRQSCDDRRRGVDKSADIDSGSPCYGGQEVLIIFDGVFVPNENIYLDGETDVAGQLVERFAGYHRQSYGGCKSGVGDVAIGAAALIAEMNGVEKASHIKDKIVEMVHLNETIWACGLACSTEGKQSSAGNYYIDPLLANVCKQNVTRYPFEIARILQDIAGGLLATLPSAKDYFSEDTKNYLEKYLQARRDISALDRIKLFRFIENLCMGRAAVGYLTESMHGAGSPQAQRVMMARLANIEEKKSAVRDLAHIEGCER